MLYLLHKGEALEGLESLVTNCSFLSVDFQCFSSKKDRRKHDTCYCFHFYVLSEYPVRWEHSQTSTFPTNGLSVCFSEAFKSKPLFIPKVEISESSEPSINFRNWNIHSTQPLFWMCIGNSQHITNTVGAIGNYSMGGWRRCFSIEWGARSTFWGARFSVLIREVVQDTHGHDCVSEIWFLARIG